MRECVSGFEIDFYVSYLNALENPAVLPPPQCAAAQASNLYDPFCRKTVQTPISSFVTFTLC